MKACIACGRVIHETDTYCRHCGKSQISARKPKSQWYYEPVWILILAFVVLGPLALPLVWKSPKMNGPTKWVMGIVIGIYGAFVLYSFWLIFVMMWRFYSELNQSLQMY